MDVRCKMHICIDFEFHSSVLGAFYKSVWFHKKWNFFFNIFLSYFFFDIYLSYILFFYVIMTSIIFSKQFIWMVKVKCIYVLILIFIQACLAPFTRLPGFIKLWFFFYIFCFSNNVIMTPINFLDCTL